ncbi:MAG: hypothetical protein ACK41E_11175 [Deinococcales bacterium]
MIASQHLHNQPHATFSGSSGADSFCCPQLPVYGLFDENGKAIISQDPDETHTVLWDGKMQNIDHYHMSAEHIWWDALAG